jgi:hypothetical protein
MTRYRKDYKDPHDALKAALAALLFLALTEKRKLLLAYIADYGTDGLLDYAETILDSGWDAHFEKAADLLSAAADDSTLEVLDASDIKFTEAFVENLERHNELIAKHEAASILGLAYDVAHDVAVPTIAGFTPAEPVLKQLSEVIERTEQQSQEFLQQQQETIVSLPIDTAIEDLSLFSGDRAAQMAHNAIVFVSGRSARASATALGATLKRSETVGDDRVCKECAENERDGWININDAFSGSETEDVPHHKNCRCSCEYEWGENMQGGLEPQLGKAA